MRGLVLSLFPRIMGEAIARAIAEWQDDVPNA
jgi:hypothetical protein